MSKRVTVYTSNTCAYCPMVKQYLYMKGHNFEEVNIEDDPGAQQEMIQMTGQARVPVVVVTDDDGSQDVTVGYNVGRLASSLA